MRKKLMLLLGAMLLMVMAGAIIITITGSQKLSKTDSQDRKIKVITTFYPVYLIGLNIADQIEEIEVNSLTELDTGCLHDYQLTTKDLKIISEADIMVINGGGMESFLDDIMTNYPDLKIIDASSGIRMLTNNSVELSSDEIHDHEEESHEEENHEEESHEEEAHDHGEFNAHVWLDPKLYLKQIENVRDGLIEYIESTKSEPSSINADFDQEDLIQRIDKNSMQYMEQVTELDEAITAYLAQLTEIIVQKETGEPIEATEQTTVVTEQPTEAIEPGVAATTVTGQEAVIFHDAFAYLAYRAGISVAFTVPLDSDTALSAGDIGKIIDEVKERQIKYLFTEQQYSDSIAKQIEAETGARVYIIDSVVTGDGEKDSYLKAMYKNLDVLKLANQ